MTPVRRLLAWLWAHLADIFPPEPVAPEHQHDWTPWWEGASGNYYRGCRDLDCPGLQVRPGPQWTKLPTPGVRQ